MWLFTIRRNCSCSSFFVSDILYCCIKAMALSAESFTIGMVDAAIRKSWQEGSSHHSSGFFERKLCAFFFVQLQNVKDDSSPLCEARGKASRAEGFRRTDKAFHRIGGLWKAEACHHL